MLFQVCIVADGRTNLTKQNRDKLRDIGIYEDLDEIFRVMAQRRDFKVTGPADGTPWGKGTRNAPRCVHLPQPTRE